MNYFEHIARKTNPATTKTVPVVRVRESRDAYQMHGQRSTNAQIATAARMAGELTLANSN